MGPRFGAKNKHYDLGLNSHFLGLFYQIAEVSGNLSYSIVIYIIISTNLDPLSLAKHNQPKNFAQKT